MIARLIENQMQLTRAYIAWALSIVASRPEIRRAISATAKALHVIRRRMGRHRRLTAATVSVVLHLLLILVLLPQTHSGLSAGGVGGTNIGEGEGLSLDLTALHSTESEALQVRELEARQFEGISESEALDEVSAAKDEVVLIDVAVAAVVVPSNMTSSTEASYQAMEVASAMGGNGAGGNSTGTVDELWNAIAPCWRRLADERTLSVNLTVSFAGNGMLAKPPVIERAPESGGDMLTLRSESLAITALAECGVYEMAAGRENVTINFPKP